MRQLATLLQANQRTRRRGERPLADHTVEQRLAPAPGSPSTPKGEGIDDWAAVSPIEVEPFLPIGRTRKAARVG
jgi:hypothetical protein